MEPQITIGITCYREGEWLRECWESALGQDDDRWEAVIVMDGGADEATRRVFEKLEHPKLRKFAFHQNVGPYPVRNKAFELTCTPYHFYLDADDLLPSDAVGLALSGFEECPSAAFVIGDVEYFGRESRVVRYPRDYNWDTVIDHLVKHGLGVPGVHRRRAWEELGGFTLDLARGGADADYAVGALEAGYGVFNVGRIMYRARERAGSVNKARSTTKWLAHETLAARHPKLLCDPRLVAYLRRGYRLSFDAYLRSGQLAEAKDIARKALVRGCAGGPTNPMWLMSRLPTCVFIALRAVRHPVRECRVAWRKLLEWFSTHCNRSSVV